MLRYRRARVVLSLRPAAMRHLPVAAKFTLSLLRVGLDGRRFGYRVAMDSRCKSLIAFIETVLHSTLDKVNKTLTLIAYLNIFFYAKYYGIYL